MFEPHLLLRKSAQLLFLILIVGKNEVKGHRGGHGKNKENSIKADTEDDPIPNFDFMNKDHVFEHMRDQITLTDKEKELMSEDEAHFLFFKSHDTDQDGRLDGLELYQSVVHGFYEYMDSERVDEDPSAAEGRAISLQKIVSRLSLTVDHILREGDKDDDGYLSYSEYAHARLADATLKEYRSRKRE